MGLKTSAQRNMEDICRRANRPLTKHKCGGRKASLGLRHICFRKASSKRHVSATRCCGLWPFVNK
jgi:hypothetical protein